eukprot:maker-scaffold_4-snap-gene-13.48-mRNA-1 protein AED:0.45 eAED:0.45 QI:0/0/0/1/0/0/2/0/110
MVSVAINMSKAEKRIQRILKHKGVRHILIQNNDGQPIRSNIEDSKFEQALSSLVSALTHKAGLTIRELNPEDKLTFLRIRTQNMEIMVAPDDDEGKYNLVVTQDTDCEEL